MYAEANGVIPTLRALPPEEVKDTLCIDSTTLDVQVGRKVASEVISLGAEMVDAPVSGGKLNIVSVGAVTELHDRRDRGKSTYAFVPCRGDGDRIRPRAPLPHPHGKEYLPLWAFWLGPRGQNMQ